VAFPVQRIRSRFPSLALRHGGRARIYFDNPAGTQVARQTVDRMREYLLHSVANVGAAFRTSLDTGALVDEAREAMAQFFNARSFREIVFGGSMTSLTLHMTRALERLFKPGDEIIVTRMDHDGNVSPWRLMAERCGLTLRWLDFSSETFRYDLAELDGLLNARTRLLAVNHASNLTGTLSDIAAIAARAKAAGALVYVDAVQSAPHVPIDVQALHCDFLVCSAYKFFGPHLGILWGRQELLESLMPPKLRAATNEVPSRYETGTQPFELFAALIGALEYYAWVGDLVGPRGKGLRSRINRGKAAMQQHESVLALELIRGIKELRGARIYGISNEAELDQRVSTVSFTLRGISSQKIGAALARREIYVWTGGFYAVDMIDKFGLADWGGVVRVGPVHYNTVAEAQRFLRSMREIAG
jgi:cysteine desulfurase family protein (TIGR01976 family)